MSYLLICRDKPGRAQTRLDNRERHLAYLKESGAVTLGGPLMDDDGAMVGSLLEVDVVDRAAAEAFAAADPYAEAGLFESVEIVPWKRLIG